MMFHCTGMKFSFDSCLEIRIRSYFILCIGHIAAHEISLFVKLQGRTGIVLIPAPAVDAPVHEPAPVIAEFFFVIQCKKPAVHPLRSTVKIIIRIGIRCGGKDIGFAAIGKPALPFTHTEIEGPCKNIRNGCFPFAVKVDENILFFFFRMTERQIAIHVFTHDTDTPFAIGACPAAYINKLAKVASSRKGLRIVENRSLPRFFCNNIDGSRSRRGATVGSIIRHADSIDAGIRSRSNIHSFDDVIRRAVKLVKQAGDPVQHHMVSVHIDSAHGKIRIHGRRSAGTDGRVILEHIGQRLGRIAESFQCLFSHTHFRVRNIHNTFISQNP